MKKRTILIVDDQQVNRVILHRLLESDYEILEADNGENALALMRANTGTISAVLLDIVMPVMDGYAVLSVMRGEPELSKIPVIVSSQKDGDEAEEKALELGAQDFIAKPYKANIIKHRLNNLIQFRESAALINKVEKDELTGLLSKQFFMEQVSDVLHQNPEKAYDLLCVGVERFKLVNDTYGVGTGDALLRHIAAVLDATPEAVLASRFSADHFYLLTPRQAVYRNQMIEPYLEKVRAFPIDMDINLNCGIYPIRNIDTAVSSMCDRAQLAADMNKGRFDALYSVYDDSLRQKLLDEQFITSSMRTALEEHQFQVYYQPKYDLTNEKIAGAEALVRWIHPTRGFMSPGAFIPLFEHNGFITQLDEYVWETACRDIRDWTQKGYPPVAVSVNVSRADVYNPRLPDILLGLIAKYQIPIRYLHLEITESAYTNNPDQIIRVVDNLRRLGFVIEMDDFGSGYSSLNMLADMPVDILRLDMGFVQHETNNPSGKGIMSFVISLAKWLDLAVVAEGVETAEQIATLRSMDCNYVQGFYFAKPMKKEDFDKLLKSNRVTEMICRSQTAAEAPSPAPAPSRMVGSGQVMLIVDDIEVNRALLASTFRDWFRIVEKSNGAEAWEYLRQHRDETAIVLLDLLMPVMDGFQLLEKIRADEHMQELPVIITSQGDEDSEQRALKMRADDFISKPYNPAIIQHRVRTVLESRYLHHLQQENRINEVQALPLPKAATREEQALLLLSTLRPYFDQVRLVDPEHTLVCAENDQPCELHACYDVWGKVSRCNNCISLKALRERTRCCKLEYSGKGLYFVASQYIPYGESGAVLELVTKLDDDYVDNILDRPLLYTRMDAVNQELNRDELTRVYNRRFMDRTLSRYIASAHTRHRNLGVAMIDLDDFKSLNDSFGHQVGDEALRTVAKMLQDNIALSKGDFVARYGGDEFLVVCRDIPQEVFTSRIKAVARLVQYVTNNEGKTIPLGISAGSVNLSEMPDADMQKLIYHADRRLYAAKHHSSGTVVDKDE